MLTVDKYHNLKEAAEYLGLSPATFRHIFYYKNNKQKPSPSYLGDKYTVKKNLNNITKEIEVTSLLRFKTSNLEKFKSEMCVNEMGIDEQEEKK